MHSSTIKKMKTSLNEVVNYHFKINDVDYFMNDLIDKKIKISWSGKVICSCGREMKKFYRSGFLVVCGRFTGMGRFYRSWL